MNFYDIVFAAAAIMAVYGAWKLWYPAIYQLVSGKSYYEDHAEKSGSQ